MKFLKLAGYILLNLLFSKDKKSEIHTYIPPTSEQRDLMRKRDEELVLKQLGLRRS